MEKAAFRPPDYLPNTLTFICRASLEFHFYDPDGHIIEVGENMTAVVKRFIDSGKTAAETTVKMDVPESYITAQLKLG